MRQRTLPQVPNLIPDTRKSNNPEVDAAFGLVRAGLVPALIERQRFYRAEFRRISAGGEPHAGLDRDDALAWLAALIRGNVTTFRRIARFTPRNDNHQALPPAPEPSDRERIRQSRPEATTGPPQTKTAPLPGGAGLCPEGEVVSRRRPRKYSRVEPGASGVAEAEDLRASHGGEPRAFLEPGVKLRSTAPPDPLREFRIFRDVETVVGLGARPVSSC
jgi:hypothetical protein